MSIAEDTHRLQTEIERAKRDLQDSLSGIGNKLHQTRDRLVAVSFVRGRPFLTLGAAFVFGVLLGYWDVPFEEVGKPMARRPAR
jgi:hypothetical protein